MTAPTPAAPTPAAEVPADPQTPAAATPAPAPPAKKSLEDSLASLDDATRTFVLGELSSARNEAKNLRERVKEAEPIVAQMRQLEEASKTELEKAQEAARLADERASKAVESIAAAEIKAALTGIVEDPASIIEDLNVSKFLKDGAVDGDAITALRGKYAALIPEQGMRPNPAQGATGADAPTAEQLAAQAAAAGDWKASSALKAKKLLDLREHTS